ncbi:MAG: elongation factor G [Bacillati bacterium ANGP1]|uniref:Elongation factor G n=2 Tax=Candidatus Segetimicrobium genomatis TaxID=2569760 RepID=A0A537LYF4_9BACT|nr:MAG: elongation factor G [Terrabacteria group bacterium ANGP1]
MKRYPADRIRNVAVAGHGGTGKTSLVEAMLFAAKAVDRLGRVEDGTTTTDFDPEEIRRKITVNAALAPLEWQETKLNLIDTPGYPDFIGEVVGALRAVESVLVAVDATAGVEVQTDKVWSLADRERLSRVVVVSRLDREHAAFPRVVEEVAERFGRRAVPVQWPIGAAGSFNGVIDLVTMTALTPSGAVALDTLPSEVTATARAARDRLVEAVAETDDRLTETFLEEGELAPETLVAGLQSGIQAGSLVPILCVAAPRGIGIPALLDALIRWLPASSRRRAVGVRAKGGEAELAAAADGVLAAQVFKTMADPYVGKLSYFRVFSGTFKSDSQVWNANKGRAERVGQLFWLRGKHQEPASEIGAGDIGAVAKLAETGTGDTLTDKDRAVTLPPIEFPKPAMAMAVEPKSKADEDKLSTALARRMEEDHTLRVQRASEMKQTVISGMGEPHLEIVADRLKRKFGVDVTLSVPRVPYRETVRAHARVQGRYKRQTGGRGQYGDCWIELDPRGRTEGYEFVDKIHGGSIPRNFIPSIEKGITEAMVEGMVAGYPVIDVRVTLVDGSYHEVDSSDMAFKIAGSMAFKKAMQEAKPVLLEPIASVAVQVPDDQMGDIIGDLNSKRARIQGMEPGGDGTSVVRAQVPMAEMLRYASDLRSITGGRGTFEMEFSHYDEVPAHIADRVIAEAKKQKEAVESH